METITINIKSEYITLDNLLKYASVVNSGGQAGQIISDGLVKINGNIVTEKRKKVWPGAQVSFAGFVLRVEAGEDES